MQEKVTYTPAEFAALFGREKTWTYRQLYAGKINGISDYGRMMIPASEAKRIEGEATRYRGNKESEKKQQPKNPAPSSPESTTNRKCGLTGVIAKRKKGPVRQKGMGRSAKRLR